MVDLEMRFGGSLRSQASAETWHGLGGHSQGLWFLCKVVGSNGGHDKVCFKEIIQAVGY